MTTFLLFNLIIQSINLVFKNLHYLSISFRFNVNIIWVFFLFTFSNIFKSIFLLIFIYSLNYFFYVDIFFNKRKVLLFYFFYIQYFNIINNFLFFYSFIFFFYVAIFFNNRSVFLFFCFYIHSFNIIKNCLLTNF